MENEHFNLHENKCMVNIFLCEKEKTFIRHKIILLLCWKILPLVENQTHVETANFQISIEGGKKKMKYT